MKKVFLLAGLIMLVFGLVACDGQGRQAAGDAPLPNAEIGDAVRLELASLLEDGLWVSVLNDSDYRLVNFEFSFHYYDEGQWWQPAGAASLFDP